VKVGDLVKTINAVGKPIGIIIETRIVGTVIGEPSLKHKVMWGNPLNKTIWMRPTGLEIISEGR
jgi:hypothetical protein